MHERVNDPDWLAHRSEKAWPGMLTLPAVSGQMSMHRNTNWYFAAASGARAEHIRQTGTQIVDEATGRREGEQYIAYDREGEKGGRNLPGQLDVFYQTPGLDRYAVDYVTVTIGGNDVGFVEVLLLAHNNSQSAELYDYIDDTLARFYDEGGVCDELRAAYQRIEEAAPNATIIAAGYPELINNAGNGSFFDPEESAYINMAVRTLNAYIRALVDECRNDGMKIEFADVEAAFRDHQAYTDDPFIQPIYYNKFDQDLKGFNLAALEIVSSYSMHPNEKGAQAYAASVQAVIDRLEAEKAEETSEQETEAAEARNTDQSGKTQTETAQPGGEGDAPSSAGSESAAQEQNTEKDRRSWLWIGLGALLLIGGGGALLYARKKKTRTTV